MRKINMQMLSIEIPVEVAEFALTALKFCDSEMGFAGYRSAYEQFEKSFNNAKKLNKDANN